MREDCERIRMGMPLEAPQQPADPTNIDASKDRGLNCAIMVVNTGSQLGREADPLCVQPHLLLDGILPAIADERR